MFGRQSSSLELSRRKFELSVYKNSDPLQNLAREEQLFTEFSLDSNSEHLLLYVNRPCVVIGKHQNPWKECNVRILGECNVPVLRRFSGGGTVYHDEGNINWSFIGSKHGFSQIENLEIIQKVAAKYSGLDEARFKISDRGDIFLNGGKISGNALAFRGDRYLHHGTLLVNTDLTSLGNSLQGWGKRFPLRFEGPGVESVPSPVTSLLREANRLKNSWNLAEFTETVSDVLEGSAAVYFSTNSGINKALGDEYRHYYSNDWHFRRTPRFFVILNSETRVIVQDGIAKEVTGMTSWDLAEAGDLGDFENYLSTHN